MTAHISLGPRISNCEWSSPRAFPPASDQSTVSSIRPAGLSPAVSFIATTTVSMRLLASTARSDSPSPISGFPDVVSWASTYGGHTRFAAGGSVSAPVRPIDGTVAAHSDGVISSVSLPSSRVQAFPLGIGVTHNSLRIPSL